MTITPKAGSRLSHRPLARAISLLLFSGAMAGTAQAQFFPPVIKLAELSGSDGFRFDGVASGDYSGFSVSSAGDINGDGIDDLIIGAPGVSQDDFNNVGSTYIVFGRSAAGSGHFPPVFSLADLDGSNGFRIDGVAPGDQFGWSVSSAGDVNGDGIDDLIIGARGASTDAYNSTGRSYIVFGRDVASAGSFPAILKLSELDGSNGFRMDGPTLGDGFGVSVSSAGDANGDGIDDLIIGAPGILFNNPNHVGGAYVVFGRDVAVEGDFPASLNLSSLDGGNGFRIDGVAPGDRAGFSVSSAGDVNGDGVDDLIIGAFRAGPDGNTLAGSSFVVFGRDVSVVGNFPALISLSLLDGSEGFRINGAAANDTSGFSVSSAGDVNGDGIDDLIIAAPGPFQSGGTVYIGAAYVLFGRDTAATGNFPATLNLSSIGSSDGFRIEGIAMGHYSIMRVSSAGDINDDGVDDLIIGAWGASPDGNESAGSSYVVFGRDVSSAGSFPAALDVSSLDGGTGFRIDGAFAGDASGYSVSAAGDINGDGIDDLIIGSYRAGTEQTFGSGSSFVVFGRGDKLFANGFEME